MIARPHQIDLAKHLQIDIFALDSTFNCVAVDSGGVLLTDESKGQCLLEMLPENLAEVVQKAAATVKSTGNGTSLILDFADSTTPRTLKLTLWPDDEGQVLYGAFQDQSETTQAYKALAEKQSQLQWLVHHAPGIISFQDADLKFLWVSVPDEGFEWVKSQDWKEKDDSDFYGEQNAATLRPLKHHVLSTGRPLQTRVVVTVSEDETRVLENHIEPRKNAEGDIVGLASYHRDVTESIRQREEELEIEQRIQAGKKLESLGLMSRSIAHEFNNFLTGILGYSELLMMEASEGSSIYNDAAAIMDSAMRAGELIQKLYAYAGDTLFNLEPQAANPLFADIAEHLRKELPTGLELTFDPLDEELWLMADRNQIHHMMAQLIRNATESIESDHGKIVLSLRRVKHQDALTQISKPTMVEIVVRDSGVGLSEASLERAFEPFYSTKFLGRGLGLAAVRGIAKGHRGEVFIANHADGGAEIKILLPQMEPMPA